MAVGERKYSIERKCLQVCMRVVARTGAARKEQKIELPRGAAACDGAGKAIMIGMWRAEEVRSAARR